MSQLCHKTLSSGILWESRYYKNLKIRRKNSQPNWWSLVWPPGFLQTNTFLFCLRDRSERAEEIKWSHEKFWGVKWGSTKHFQKQMGGHENILTFQGGAWKISLNCDPWKFPLHIFVNFNTVSCKTWRKFWRFAPTCFAPSPGCHEDFN